MNEQKAQSEFPAANYRTDVWFGTQKVTWCVHDTKNGFRHWLEAEVGGETLRSEIHSGWSLITTIRVGDKTYAACTANFDGVLPAEKPFQIVEGSANGAGS